MAVTTSNLIMGPGILYRGNFGAVEPADTAVNTTPPTSSWTDMGGTMGGVNVQINQSYTALEVDQIVDTPERRLTSRETRLVTQLAEPTLENLGFTLNNLSSVSSGAGFKAFSPPNDNSATQPTYYALIFDGYAPTSFRRRVIARKVLSVENVEFAYSKAGQTVFTVTFATHFVSAATPPYKLVDQTS